MDLDHPPARQIECLSSSATAFIITDCNPFILPGWKEESLISDGLRVLARAEGDHRDGEEGLAYVIHTSGSTGKPKAVRVIHRCIVPNITDLKEEFKLTSDDVILMASPFTFDPSIVDLFLGLSTGARLVMVQPSFKAMPERLARIMRHEKVSFLQATPSLFLRLDPSSLTAGQLRLVVLGGEPFPPLEILRSYSGVQFYNIYGTKRQACFNFRF